MVIELLGALALRGEEPLSGYCPMDRALAVVGTRSAVLILREALNGARRCEEFQDRLPGLNASGVCACKNKAALVRHPRRGLPLWGELTIAAVPAVVLPSGVRARRHLEQGLIHMEFGVIHEIHDAAAWQADLDSHAPWPDDFTLLAFVEGKDKTRAMCLWRAPDEVTLQHHLDKNLGRGAVNVVVPVDLRYFAETVSSQP
jgi:hypothetical protein